MPQLAMRLRYLEWGFWLGGAVFVMLFAFTMFLVTQDDPPSAENEWIPIACAVLTAFALLVCVGSRVGISVLIERALNDAWQQYKHSDPNTTPNAGQLAMLAGLPEGWAWQARQFLSKQK